MILTGFTSFGSVAVNPSQLIIEAVAARHPVSHLVTAVLPVEYAAAGRWIVDLIHSYQPEAVVCLGIAQNRKAINLERVALNLNDAAIPDNAGDLATGRLIDPAGPPAYWSNLPLDTMLAALQARGIPAAISNHAGAYVCNHVFYVARRELERMGSGAACGFIHVPPLSEPADHSDGLPLAIMMDAVECCLEILETT